MDVVLDEVPIQRSYLRGGGATVFELVVVTLRDQLKLDAEARELLEFFVERGGRNTRTGDQQTSILKAEGNDAEAVAKVDGNAAGDAGLHSVRINARPRQAGLQADDPAELFIGKRAGPQEKAGEGRLRQGTGYR